MMLNARDNISKKESNKKILSIVHLLHPYVKQRIRVGETEGFFPKNMFQSNGIIDELILQVYENKLQIELEEEQLRIVMFDLANKKLLNLFENEKWHKNTISTKFILEEELKQLEENFTVDSDNDLIMNEDLDDISYHQDEQTEQMPYEESQNSLGSFLDVKDDFQFKYDNKSIFTKNYNKLPLQTSNVVDLYLLGKLNMQEIATILQIEIIEVKRIMDYVKEKFKNLIK